MQIVNAQMLITIIIATRIRVIQHSAKNHYSSHINTKLILLEQDRLITSTSNKQIDEPAKNVTYHSIYMITQHDI